MLKFWQQSTARAKTLLKGPEKLSKEKVEV
jgi:hypothetical protein